MIRAGELLCISMAYASLAVVIGIPVGLLILTAYTRTHETGVGRA